MTKKSDKKRLLVFLSILLSFALLAAACADDDDGDVVDKGDAEPIDQHDDALEQELREIESLRVELSGLRDRIWIGVIFRI